MTPSTHEDRFHKRALWVVGIGLTILVVATIAKRLFSQVVVDSGLTYFYINVAICVINLAALWFRKFGRACTRFTLYSATAVTFLYVSQHGGLLGFQFMSLLVLPPLCALLFGSRETAFFALVFCIGVAGLFVFHPTFPIFEVEASAELPLATIMIGGSSMLIITVLVVLVNESEQSDATLRRLLAEQHFAATHDELTGLSNRSAVRSFMAGLDSAERAYQVFLIDLDGFKSINDRFGHNSGDEVLVQVGKVLSNVAMQAPLVARLGGDEFLIVIELNPEQPQTPIKAGDFGNTLVDALDLEFVFDGVIARISASVGSAQSPLDSNRGSEVMKLADKALYEAKAAGKSCYVKYDQTSRTRLTAI